MKIMYGRTAYVHDISKEMISFLENMISSWSQSDNSFCITMEDLISHVDEYQDKCNKDPNSLSKDEHKLGKFLTKVRSKLDGEIGDIVFSKL